MYHLVDNLTNTSGDALVGYYVKLKDSEGAYATLYSDASSTPIATVSGVADAGMTDSTGMYDIYVADGDYDIEFFDKNDATRLVQRKPAIPMYGLQSSADLADAVTAAEAAQAAAEASVDAVQADLASTATGKGDDMVVTIQSGTSAVARTVRDKLRERVSIDDFLTTGVNARQALERAATAATVVELAREETYEFDQAAVIPAGVRIIGNRSTITTDGSYTDPNLLTLGGGCRLDDVLIDGTGLPALTSTWAGVQTIPTGTAVYSGGVSQAAQNDPIEFHGCEWDNCPGGAVFTRYTPVIMDRCELGENMQTATVVYKSSGSYSTTDTTNNLANELITNAQVEVYYGDHSRVTNTHLRHVRSKGLVFSGVGSHCSGCTFAKGTPRHAQLYLSDNTTTVSGWNDGGGTFGENDFDGGPDFAVAIKVNLADGFIIGPNAMRNVTAGIYIQSSRNATVGPQTIVEYTDAAFYFDLQSDSAGDLENIVVSAPNCVTTQASARGIKFSTSADAVSTGLTTRNIRFDGGSFEGGEYGLSHGTPGFNPTIENVVINGTRFRGQTAGGVVGVMKSGSIRARFEEVTTPLVIGTYTGVAGTHIEADIEAIGCTGVIAQVGATYDLQLDSLSLRVKGTGGTRAVQMILDGSDYLKMLDLDVMGYNQSTTASAVALSLNSTTMKGRLRVALPDGSGGQNAITFTDAGSLTGVFKEAMCTITGTHGLTT